ERQPDLAARRPRQELAERHDIGKAGLVEPAPASDELGAEIAQMRHRPAKGGEAEPEKSAEDFERRPGLALHRLARLRHPPPRLSTLRQPARSRRFPD